MSMSKKDRLKYLAVRLESLSAQIHKAGREDEYLTFANDLATTKTAPRTVDEDAWNLMLPKEQDLNLLIHYHTLRTEAFTITEELKKASIGQTVKDVLDSPYVKGPIAVAALVKVAAAVVALGGSLGLFFVDDSKENRTFWA